MIKIRKRREKKQRKCICGRRPGFLWVCNCEISLSHNSHVFTLTRRLLCLFSVAGQRKKCTFNLKKNKCSHVKAKLTYFVLIVWFYISFIEMCAENICTVFWLPWFNYLNNYSFRFLLYLKWVKHIVAGFYQYRRSDHFQNGCGVNHVWE